MTKQEQAYAEAAKRQRILETVAEMEAYGLKKEEIARQMGMSRTTLFNWQKAYIKDGFDGLLPKPSCGGPQPMLLMDEEANAVKDRIRQGMSEVMALRTCCFHGFIREPLASKLINRKNKHDIPSRIRSQIHVSQSVIRYGQSTKDFSLEHLTTPRTLQEVINGERVPITPGDWFVFDDMTVNFGWWVPWPHADCECSRRYGVKLTRGQLLASMDVASLNFLYFDLLARKGESYRGNDIMAMMGMLFRKVGMPRRRILIEGGSWQSGHVKGKKVKGEDGNYLESRAGGLAALGLDALRSYTGKTKQIEGRFNFLQTMMCTLPNTLGRKRENQKEWKIYQQCISGARDPRDYYPSIDVFAEKIRECMELCNNEPLSGKTKGVPVKLWEKSIERAPLKKPAAHMNWVFAREQKAVTVPKNCTLKIKCRQGNGEEHLYFQHAALHLIPIKGLKVQVHYDPFETEMNGVVMSLDPRHFDMPQVNDEPPRRIKTGDIICVAHCLKPSCLYNPEGDENLAITKEVRNNVKRVGHVISGGKNRRQKMVEAYDGFGNAKRMETGSEAASTNPEQITMPAPVTTTVKRQPKRETVPPELASLSIRDRHLDTKAKRQAEIARLKASLAEL